MTSDPTTEWTTEKVLQMLREQAGPGQRASAQVFLRERVSSSDVPGLAQAIFTRACERATSQSRPPGAGPEIGPEIGKVHRLAKSFSVNAGVSVIAEIARSEDVRAILPNQIADIYPKPTPK